MGSFGMGSVQAGGMRRAGRPRRPPAGMSAALAIACGAVLAAVLVVLAALFAPTPAAAQSPRASGAGVSGGGFYGIDDGNYAVFSARPDSRSGAAPAAGAAEYIYRGNSPMPAYPGSGGGRGVKLEYNRQLVPYASADPPGTIIVDTGARYLYLIQGGGRALRYGIGVGRDGFAWSGAERISRKAEWPNWTPPAEMQARQPGLPATMAGGPDNPLGARALYLGTTLYRIHGTSEADSIGEAVSSGCIRLRNDDVIDLYDRVRVGTLVRVI